jgi:hypothetical protein
VLLRGERCGHALVLIGDAGGAALGDAIVVGATYLAVGWLLQQATRKS